MSVAVGLEKPLGGYMELQLPDRGEYYPSLIKLNAARSCLEYILKVKRYDLIYIPYYTCEALLNPIIRLGVQFKFYHIDAKLDPVLDFDLGPSACMLYTNYFGIKENTVKTLRKHIDHLIVDNSQAFYSDFLSQTDTFYSCRKFFGVPDGAYLHINSTTRLTLERDVSIERFSHLIKRIDLGAEHGYSDFVAYNKEFDQFVIKEMSGLSLRILESIDYEDCKNKRNSNFAYLHSYLSKYNELFIDSSSVKGPMTYPFLIRKKGLKQELIKNQIFVPTYWPGVFDLTTPDMCEYYISEYLLALPIDHRYNLLDMNRLIEILIKLL